MRDEQPGHEINKLIDENVRLREEYYVLDGKNIDLTNQVKGLKALLIDSLSIVHCPFTTQGTPCGECEACMDAQAHGERVLEATKKGGEE